MTRTHITKSCDDCGIEIQSNLVYKNNDTKYWLQVHGAGRNEFRDRNSRPLDFCCAACMINYYERNELVTTPAFTALDKLITALEQLSVPSILAHPTVVIAKEVIKKAVKRDNIISKTNDAGIGNLSDQLSVYLKTLKQIQSTPNTHVYPATTTTTTTTTPYCPDTYYNTVSSKTIDDAAKKQPDSFSETFLNIINTTDLPR